MLVTSTQIIGADARDCMLPEQLSCLSSNDEPGARVSGHDVGVVSWAWKRLATFSLHVALAFGKHCHRVPFHHKLIIVPGRPG